MNLREGFLSSPLLLELAEIAASGEPYPESAAKRHHLVPRFLLVRFARPDSERERVMQLDVRSGKNYWVDPGTAASRTRFYRLIDDDGTVHQRLEFYLSRVENHSAPAIGPMINRPRSLSAADRATLSTFLALLEGRTIAGLDRLQHLAQSTLRTMVVSRVADADSFAEDIRQAIGTQDRDEIERQRLYMITALKDGRITLANPKEIAVDLLLRSAADTAQHNYQMRWDLLQTHDAAFATSDRGLAMHDPEPPHPWSGHAILSSPRAETTIPLDPHHCLLLRPPIQEQLDAGLPTTPVAAAQARLLNLRTYGLATDYIFTDSQQTATAIRADAKTSSQPRSASPS